MLYRDRFSVSKDSRLDADVMVYAMPSPENVESLLVCAILVCVRVLLHTTRYPFTKLILVTFSFLPIDPMGLHWIGADGVFYIVH